jgi:GNAT superfamily N-acetyltransferase
MDIAEAFADDAADLALLLTGWRQVVLGRDEPPCTEAEAAVWFAPRPGRRRVAFVAREGDLPVAVARMQLRTDGEVPGFVPELFVVPGSRRQGIGRAMVAALTATALAGGAPALVLRQDDSSEDAAAFADALGTTRGFLGLQNRCRIDRLQPAVLQGWVDRARERAAGWSLVGWDGPCPDDLLERFVAVQSAMLGAAVPDIAVTHRSAADIRAAEAVSDALGIDRWTLAARRDVDGVLGGFTEMELDPAQPWLGHQGDTAVLPEHRGVGLGRWLKAMVALRLLAERPEVTQIETNTAADNPPMRAINEAMGFEPVVVWQDRVLALR